MADLVVHDLGRATYADAETLQRRLLEGVWADPAAATHLLLVEHDPPVITLGRRGGHEHVVASAARLAAEGVEVVETRRGGDVTYHGPGQLVAYVVRSLRPGGRTVRGHVTALESAVIDLLAGLGISAERRAGRPGAWVGGAKVAAVGVAVSRWATWHGLALNVSSDLSGFELIVPCGLADAGVTSVSRLLGREVALAEIKPALTRHLAEALGCGRIVAAEADPPADGRLPSWLRRPLPPAGLAHQVGGLLETLGLHTVCQGARCPNRGECFARGTATFLILGDRCTRSCRYCAVPGGPPRAVDPAEPDAVAAAAERLGLRHVVITSVTRDDLPDGGAGHFARTVRAVRRRLPAAAVEVLTPDFRGDAAAIDQAADARPDVFNHNLETVPRLYRRVRPQADYRRSLDLLDRVRRRSQAAGYATRTKSGLMVGLGETRRELRDVMRDLLAVGCDMLTVGQYLAPTPRHVQPSRYLPPSEFEAIAAEARRMGFAAVAAGPFVRSSYRAEGLFAASAGPAATSPAPGGVPTSGPSPGGPERT